MKVYDKDPLVLLTAEEQEYLSKDRLSRLKRAKLLLFQLSDGYTINLNGHDIDKNTLIVQFDKIANIVETKPFLFVPGLKAFLSSEYLRGFSKIAYLDFDQIPTKYTTVVIEKISQKIDSHLGYLIVSGGIETEEIISIFDFCSVNFGDHFDTSFDQSYLTIHDYIIGLQKKYTSPFSSLSTSVLKKEMVKQINSKFSVRLTTLPSLFDALKIEYSRWLHASVLDTILNRDLRIENFSRVELIAMRKASLYVAEYILPVQHKKFANKLTRYLNRTRKFSAGKKNTQTKFKDLKSILADIWSNLLSDFRSDIRTRYTIFLFILFHIIIGVLSC